MKNSTNPEARDELLRKKTEILEKEISQAITFCTFQNRNGLVRYIQYNKRRTSFYWNMAGTKHIFFDLGYGGNGITFSMIGTQIIRNTLQGIKDERKDIFGFERIL